MKTLIITVCCFVFVLASLAYAEDVKDSAAWWLKSYGGVTAKDEPLVDRAERIFERVAAAADKNGKRFPRLVVINYAYDPYAASIRDGSIILTLGGLKLCYIGVNQDKGDSRLAFLLGHELAHQSKDDHWHAAAFAAVKGSTEGCAEARTALLTYLRDSAGEGSLERAQEATKVKELQADSYGLLYMAMAGYDPKAVIDKDGTNFFHDWVTQIAGGSSFNGPGYPDSKERAEFFRTQLVAVANELDLFTFGVRLYQIGNYEDALLLLDRFREKFPSREVFSNIALAYFQSAIKDFAACDPNTPFRFKLPAVIDVSTLASGFTTRKLLIECQENETYRRKLVNAISHLVMASSKDTLHLPTQVNLASAYIMAGEYSKAMAASDAALKISPANPLAANCKAVSLYLFGQSSTLDTTDTALALLREAALRNPEVSDSFYNQATMAYERERDAAAKEAWKAFLAKESEGPYAELARNFLDMSTETAPSVSRANALQSPMPLGEIRGETAKMLKGAVKQSFSIGRTSVDVYKVKGIRALVINGTIEIAETALDKPYDLLEFKRLYGEPLKTVTTTSGQVLVYRTVAADVQNARIQRLMFFGWNRK
jgi:tetratricopeptide (TPR) repeat protein